MNFCETTVGWIFQWCNFILDLFWRSSFIFNFVPEIITRKSIFTFHNFQMNPITFSSDSIFHPSLLQFLPNFLNFSLLAKKKRKKYIKTCKFFITYNSNENIQHILFICLSCHRERLLSTRAAWEGNFYDKGILEKAKTLYLH